MSNALQNSVIIPREDFSKLQDAAYEQAPQTASEHFLGVLHSAGVAASLATAFVAAVWGWAKAMEWRDNKVHERLMIEKQFDLDHDLFRKVS